nr:phosphoribosylaminoimidazolesuccinocarboxamide synthase [Roseofilum sp. SID1]
MTASKRGMVRLLDISSQGFMTEQVQLYEGKAKIVYSTDDADILLTYFKDDATAFNAQKRGTITGKGQINCAISRHLFQMLEAQGIPTHYVDCPSEREMRVKAVTIVPIEAIVRNRAAGSLCKQTGLALGTEIDPPLVEYCYKNDSLGDPLLTRDRLLLLQLATLEELDHIQQMSRDINRYLSNFFQECGIILVDFKLEFGRDRQNNIILADEISPDTCRLWKQDETDPQARILDKDRFRQDLGDVESAYEQVLERVLGQPK